MIGGIIIEQDDDRSIDAFEAEDVVIELEAAGQPGPPGPPGLDGAAQIPEIIDGGNF